MSDYLKKYVTVSSLADAVASWIWRLLMVSLQRISVLVLPGSAGTGGVNLSGCLPKGQNNTIDNIAFVRGTPLSRRFCDSNSYKEAHLRLVLCQSCH